MEWQVWSSLSLAFNAALAPTSNVFHVLAMCSDTAPLLTQLLAQTGGRAPVDADDASRVGVQLNAARESDGATPLHIAAARGHVHVVSALIEGGANVESVNEKTCATPLHEAARHGHADVIAVFLAHGARLEAAAAAAAPSTTPLWLAAVGGHVHATRTLLEAYAARDTPVNITQASSGTNLLNAVAHVGSVAVFDLLLEFMPPSVFEHACRAGIMSDAAASGNAGMVTRLLDAGVSPHVGELDLTPPPPSTDSAAPRHVPRLIICRPQPLYVAVTGGHASVVSRLLDAGVSVEGGPEYGASGWYGSRGGTPLTDACKSGHVDIVRELLARGAQVNAPTSIGRTALVVAVEAGHADVVDVLCAHAGVTIMTPPPQDVASGSETWRHDNTCPLFAAVTAVASVCAPDVRARMLATLLRTAREQQRQAQPAAPLTPDADGAWQTQLSFALAAAVYMGDADSADALLDAGGDPLTALRYTRYSMRVAVNSSDTVSARVFNTLLSRCAHDLRGSLLGAQLLDAAVRTFREQRVRALLNVDVVSRHEGDVELLRAVYTSIHVGADDVFCALMEHVGGEGGTLERSGVPPPPAHDARSRCMRALLEHEAEWSRTVSLPTDLSWGGGDARASVTLPPLIVSAAYHGCIHAVNALLAVGVDVDVANAKGTTALHLATRCGHTCVMRALVRRGGADLSPWHVNGKTPLHVAARHYHPHSVLILCAAGASTEVRTKMVDDWPSGTRGGDTPLFIAIGEDDAEAVNALLAAGANPNARVRGMLPLVYARKKEVCGAIIGALLAVGARET